MHFGENQLSRSLIGLSPLSTGHPRIFQHSPVRTSTPCYWSFILPMDRSLGFGSTAYDLSRAIHTRFRYGYAKRLNLAAHSKSQAHYAKGMRSPRKAPTVCRRMISGSISLPSTGFFSPFPHGTGSLSVTDEYLALEGGPPRFRRGFTCPVLLGNPVRVDDCFAQGALTRFGRPFQVVTLTFISLTLQVPQPRTVNRTV